MDRLEKLGESVLAVTMGLVVVFLLFVHVSEEEYEETVQIEPKHPMIGVMAKNCVKYQFKCPVLAGN